jgi:triacylglycerol lipase
MVGDAMTPANTATLHKQHQTDPRHGKAEPPRYPVVLAHGLLGFSELPLGTLGSISYWNGISPAFSAHSITHVTTSVPPTHSIQDRAAVLARAILDKARDTPINIVAHSMGGLDARYMISCLKPHGVDVRSLVTVATPHRGSAFADYVLGGLHRKQSLHESTGGGRTKDIQSRVQRNEEGLTREDVAAAERETEKLGWWDLRNLYWAMERMGLGTDAFSQLTQGHMCGRFNPTVQDVESVRYFSYGAALTSPPPLLSPFRLPYRIISSEEGPNDGLVSVESSRWGEYKGTLVGVSHLDLINWSNRLRWTVRGWMGMEKPFNAVAFYLDIANMLAKEGL